MVPHLLLYADAIEHCEDFLRVREGDGVKNAGKIHGILRRCVQAAYRELMARRTWRYNMKLGNITLAAPYSTGTVVYDHTGGTYERQLTLTSGTWPDWAAYGTVRISDVNYTVEDRKSSTVVTLDPQNNPGADVTSTSYEIFRSFYTLPNDFVAMGHPQPADNWGCAGYISVDEYLLLERQGYSTGTPQFYTILRDPSFHGSMAVALYPAPSAAASWQYMYHSRGRQMKFSGWDETINKGKISTTADSTTVTGKGTAFSDDMVGAILRIGNDGTNAPTGLDGHTPFVDERLIVAVASTTSLTIDAGAASTESEVKYNISDVVDIEAGMVNAFLRACEKQLADMFPLKDRKNILEAYEYAYIKAGESDNRSLATRVAGGVHPYIHNYTVSSEVE